MESNSPRRPECDGATMPEELDCRLASISLIDCRQPTRLDRTDPVRKAVGPFSLASCVLDDTPAKREGKVGGKPREGSLSDS